MRERQTILIAEDEKINRMILTKILSPQYDLVEAEDGGQALAYLKAHPRKVSAVILDLMMPKMDGFDFLRIYHQTPEFQTLPLLVATGEANGSVEEQCLFLGAWDFVSKPYNAQILRFRLKNAIDRSQLGALQELQHMADFDPVSEIFNKRKFEKLTAKMLSDYPRQQFAIVHFDLDHFKLVNGFFGEAEGNRLIRYIAQQLENYESKNPLFTYGHKVADQFFVCVHYHSHQKLITEFERIAHILSTYPLDFDLVPNFGVALVQDRTMELSRICDQAELAASSCKGNYLHHYAFYEPSMSDAVIREQNIISSMVPALEQHQFVVYYQPKYDLRNETISGAEALVRWQRPGMGMVSPGEFIPIFERNGFITKLDYYVWEEVCIRLRAWLDEGKKPLPISVNLSRVSLNNPKLEERLCGLIKKYRLPIELLELELTESAYTSNPAVVLDMAQRLHADGFTILMDDFGSGYSSLNTLKDIAVDVLKIDMVFLDQSQNIDRGESILASVIHMAKWLNTPVIVEGVETAQQVHFLRGIGCEYVQGYFFARPMPVEDYERMAFQKSPDSMQPNLLQPQTLWDKTSQMETLFSSIMQAAAVFEYDGQDLELLRVNDAYCDLFGYQDLDHKEIGLLKRIAPEEAEKLQATLAEAIRTQNMAECEFKRALDEETMWIYVKVRYIGQAGPKAVLFGVLTDITAQKKIGEELQKYRAALAATAERQKILIVDDQELNREELKNIFERQFDVFEAENGQKALEIMKQEQGKLDVVLLDLIMPVLGGQEFIEFKNQEPLYANIPVVVITVEDAPAQQVHYLHLGVSDYIVKPFVPEIVLRRVCNVLESAQHMGQTLLWSQQTMPADPADPADPVDLLPHMVGLLQLAASDDGARNAACMDVYDRLLKVFFPSGQRLMRTSANEIILWQRDSMPRQQLLDCLTQLLQVGEKKSGLQAYLGVVLGESDLEKLFVQADTAVQKARQTPGKPYLILSDGDQTEASSENKCKEK